MRSGVALPEAALRDRERARGRGRSLGPLIFGTLGALQELGALPLPELGAPSTERSTGRSTGRPGSAPKPKGAYAGAPRQGARSPPTLPGRELARSQRSPARRPSLRPSPPAKSLHLWKISLGFRDFGGKSRRRPTALLNSIQIRIWQIWLGDLFRNPDFRNRALGARPERSPARSPGRSRERTPRSALQGAHSKKRPP